MGHNIILMSCVIGCFSLAAFYWSYWSLSSINHKRTLNRRCVHIHLLLSRTTTCRWAIRRLSKSIRYISVLLGCLLWFRPQLKESPLCISVCLCLYLRMSLPVSPPVSACISVCLCLYLRLFLYVSLSVAVSICSSVSMFVCHCLCFFTCISVCLSSSLCVCLSLSDFVAVSISLSFSVAFSVSFVIFVSACLPARLSLYLSVCLQPFCSSWWRFGFGEQSSQAHDGWLF